jgi:hypothetical protein
VLALTLETAKMIAIAIALGLLIVEYFIFKFIKEVTTKAILVLVVGGLILGMWSQRTSLNSCGDRVIAKIKQGDLSATTCSFFGFDATVKVPGKK